MKKVFPLLALWIFATGAQVVKPPVIDTSATTLSSGTYSNGIVYESAPVTIPADKNRVAMSLDASAFPNNPNIVVTVGVFFTPDNGVTLVPVCVGTTTGFLSTIPRSGECPNPFFGTDAVMVTTLMSQGGDVDTQVDIAVANKAEILAGEVHHSVAFDAVASANAVGLTSLTWTHTITGANTLLLVGDMGTVNGAEVSGVTFNSVALTQKTQLTVDAGNELGIDVWYLTGQTGTHSVTISNFDAVDYVGIAMSFTGVNQVTPLGTEVTNLLTPLDSGSVTVPSNGMAADFGLWAHGSAACTATATTVAGGQTKQVQDCANAGGAAELGFASTRTATGNFTWSDGADAFTGAVAVPINAATSTAVRHHPIIQ